MERNYGPRLGKCSYTLKSEVTLRPVKLNTLQEPKTAIKAASVAGHSAEWLSFRADCVRRLKQKSGPHTEVESLNAEPLCPCAILKDCRALKTFTLAIAAFRQALFPPSP